MFNASVLKAAEMAGQALSDQTGSVSDGSAKSVVAYRSLAVETCIDARGTS
jgi:hypothetical protein